MAKKPMFSPIAPKGRFALRSSDGSFLLEEHNYNTVSIYLRDTRYAWVEIEDCTLYDYEEANRKRGFFPKGICEVVRIKREVA
jgi:hypothetical protein